jgi:hypothetical protein
MAEFNMRACISALLLSVLVAQASAIPAATNSQAVRELLATATPKEGCFCIALFKPVCGVDGQQYGNSCQAGCAGVAVASDRDPNNGCRKSGPEHPRNPPNKHPRGPPRKHPRGPPNRLPYPSVTNGPQPIEDDTGDRR